MMKRNLTQNDIEYQIMQELFRLVKYFYKAECQEDFEKLSEYVDAVYNKPEYKDREEFLKDLMIAWVKVVDNDYKKERQDGKR